MASKDKVIGFSAEDICKHLSGGGTLHSQLIAMGYPVKEVDKAIDNKLEDMNKEQNDK